MDCYPQAGTRPVTIPGPGRIGGPRPGPPENFLDTRHQYGIVEGMEVLTMKTEEKIHPNVGTAWITPVEDRKTGFDKVNPIRVSFGHGSLGINVHKARALASELLTLAQQVEREVST